MRCCNKSASWLLPPRLVPEHRIRIRPQAKRERTQTAPSGMVEVNAAGSVTAVRVCIDVAAAVSDVGPGPTSCRCRSACVVFKLRSHAQRRCSHRRDPVVQRSFGCARISDEYRECSDLRRRLDQITEWYCEIADARSPTVPGSIRTRRGYAAAAGPIRIRHAAVAGNGRASLGVHEPFSGGCAN